MDALRQDGRARCARETWASQSRIFEPLGDFGGAWSCGKFAHTWVLRWWVGKVSRADRSVPYSKYAAATAAQETHETPTSLRGPTTSLAVAQNDIHTFCVNNALQIDKIYPVADIAATSGIGPSYD